MKNLFKYIALSLLVLTGCNGHKYESVKNDPIGARFYKLDNGLTVALAVNKDQPRIHTFVGVRTGGKNDPAQTTGLSHYLEHLMFKGTDEFGTSDYQAEKPILDQIEQAFEEYRQMEGKEERTAMYAKIDSLSQEASKFAIANEYDKLMSAIGSEMTNAMTTMDYTAFIENIPSNQVETWAMIEAERFTDPVIRLFHTELESVYEEYNMSLVKDNERSNQAIYEALFEGHPYGNQTVLGKGEHLKNPSIVNLKKHIANYYVPENMIVCMAGDFDPDEVIAIIDRHFGKIPRGNGKPAEISSDLPPITEHMVRNISGLQSDNVYITYRIDSDDIKDYYVADMIHNILVNGQAGLMDININQKQATLGCAGFTKRLDGFVTLSFYGIPKQGQTVEDVEKLIMEQINLLKTGEFDDKLIKSSLNRMKLFQQLQIGNTTNMAHTMLSAYIYKDDWKDVVNKMEYLSSLTKEDILEFADKWLGENYVTVYKRKGELKSEKIDKPQITPVSANRDMESEYLAAVKEIEVKPIEPVFLDYQKDISQSRLVEDVPFIYTKNTGSDIFNLYFVFEMGTNSDKDLEYAFEYLHYLGTSSKSVEQIKSELYEIACFAGFEVNKDQIKASVWGLSENFEDAVDILMDWVSDPKEDKAVWDDIISGTITQMSNTKFRQDMNFSLLRTYGFYGSDSPSTFVHNPASLLALDHSATLEKAKNIMDYKHKVLYFGPESQEEIAKSLSKYYDSEKKLLDPLPEKKFTRQDTDKNTIYLAHYNDKQVSLSMMSKRGGFDKKLEPVRQLYNQYFSGSMNGIVFQEMREARGLAYSSGAGYTIPSKADQPYYMLTRITTQSDKMMDAIKAFHEILDDMPQSETSFNLAKDEMMALLRTKRITGENILWNYMDALEFGYDYDRRKDLYEVIPTLTLKDIVDFQQNYVKGLPYTYCILGDIRNIDQKALKSIGNIEILSTEDIFGY